ncbi:MAG: hypothetical protein H6747_03160 [Deltaproteobacteria bacterium]|nr:hypothetical protein [Deltaproteobacteria bacterium]
MTSYCSFRHAASAFAALALVFSAGCGDSFPTFEDATQGADVTSDTGGVADVSGDVVGDTAGDTGEQDGKTDTGGTDIGGVDADTGGQDGDTTVGDADTTGTDGDATGEDGDGTGGDGDATGPVCPGGVDCACSKDDECSSGICRPNGNGDMVCYAACTEQKDCGDNTVCSPLGDGKKGCAESGLAKDAPCTAKEVCLVGDADGVCASFGGEGMFCRSGCTEASDCGSDENCVEADLADGSKAKVCMPNAGGAPQCTKFAVATGSETTCYAAGLPGCTAPRKCETMDNPALQACASAAATPEVCDGGDNDCDGQVDEGDTLCDDGNGCTTDVCKGKDGCESGANTEACDDGNACTKDDTCALSLCAGVTVTCDDGNACTDDACDMATGCTTTDNTNACDDGDACTKDDTCALALCEGATITCDDGNLCTDDACDMATGCTATANTAGCDDGDACTKDDTCAATLCGGVTVDCDDGDACTDDSCDPKAGCAYSKNTSPCDDGDACTEKDTCDGVGNCKGSTVDCEDGNTCTDDPCDPKTGCADKKLTTKPCDDGNACTKDDTCDGKGACAATPVDCEDGNTCTDDPCDPKSGCGPKKNTTKPCDDGDACTEKDTCDGNGACKATPVNCEDGDQCTDDPCDPKTGCAPKKNNTKPCDDKANCKVDGVCDGNGNCTKLVDSCDDNNPCTNDVCKNGQGCDYTPTNEGVECIDGDACTDLDKCAGGKCVGTAKNCDDNNVCTDDSCKDGSCVNLANEATCTDNSVCTGGDFCKDGKCEAGKTWTCEDGLQCTDDPCDPVKGCLLKKLTTKPCDDGDPCSGKSQCDGKGTCVGTAPTVCDDGKECTTDACIKGVGCLYAAVPADVACNDGNLCLDKGKCDGKGACVGTDNTGKACDDGNSCTVKDSCDPKLGCVGGPLDNCTPTYAAPYSQAFACGAAMTGWTGIAAAGSTVAWRVDGMPTPPGKPAPDCSLNFNDDTSFEAGCSGAIKPVSVWSPTIDLSAAKLPSLTLKVAGGWENSTFCDGPGDLCDWLQVLVAEVVGGTPGTPTVVNTPPSPGASTWKDVSVDLSAYAGKMVQIGFTFGTDDCIGNTGSGPFIDDVMVVDNSCTNGASCDDGNACTDDACDAKTGKCTHINNDLQKCEDGDLCKGPDSCKAGVCVAGAAKDCSDANLCTTNEFCDPKDGACKAGGMVDCNDGDVCTADSCNGKTGVCAHTPVAGCKPTCSVDTDCEVPNLCQTAKCEAGSCAYSTTNEGGLCAIGSLCASGKCVAQTAGWAKDITADPNGAYYCALLHSGEVACWGKNDQGQAGVVNSKADVGKPTLVAGLKDIVQVSAGTDHTCALDKAGKVWCWGDNSYGQLGDNGSSDSDKPVEATQITDATYVDAGGDFTCWITKTATVKCLGSGSSGRLGYGSTSSSKTPVEVKGLTGVVALHTQYYFSCATRNDQTLWCWGYNYDTQLDADLSSTVSEPVIRKGAMAVQSADGGYATSCWTSAGNVWCVGDNSDGQIGDGTTDDASIPYLGKGPTGVIAVPGGGDHSIALTTSGTMWATGANFYGQMGFDDSDDQLGWIKTGFPTDIIAVDSTNDSICAITKAGKVVCAGQNTDGQLGGGATGGSSSKPVTVLDFCKIDGDCDDNDPCTSNTCASGQCEYKASSGGKCDDGDACTDTDTCVDGTCGGKPYVCNDGDACTIGESCAAVGGKPVCIAGADKVCDDGKPCTADSCDSKTGDCVYAPVPGCLIGCKSDAACNDGNVCTADSCNTLTGGCSYTNAADGAVCGLGGVCGAGSCKPVAAGWAKSIRANSYGYFFCAQTQEDGLACWGRNDQGQLGAELAESSSNQPVLVKGVAGVKAYDTGTDHACAIDKDDKLWCWGDNFDGQLGDGTKTDSNKPLAVTFAKNAADVCAGDGFTCVRHTDGTMSCWGDNYYGQLGDGTTTDSTTAAVKVKDLAGVVAIDCDNNAVCATTTAGQLYCWGDNGDKEIDADQGFAVSLPTALTNAVVSVFGSGYDTNCFNDGDELYCRGDNFAGQLGDGTTTDSATPVKVVGPKAGLKVTGGYDHMVVLAGDGSIWSAGDNADGQIGDGTTTDAKAWFKGPWAKAIVDVAAGYGTTCGLAIDGQIYCVGKNLYGEAGQPGTTDQASIVTVPPVCSTDAHCNDGDACTADSCNKLTGVCVYKATDCDDSNACTVGEACDSKTGTCVAGKAVDCDDGNECTLDACDKATGVCSSTTIKGCIPSCKKDTDCPGNPCAAVACTVGKCIYTPENNGQICEPGKTCNAGSCTASGKGWAAALHASPGSYHLCATTTKGELACWGDNLNGQIGNNSTTDASAPVLVSGIKDPIDVALGYQHTCAINGDGKTYCWGDNYYGQLGDGTTTDSKTPVLAKDAQDFVDLELGYNLTCGKKADGSLWCWGYNTNGRLGIGGTSNVSTPTQVVGTTGVGSWAHTNEAGFYIHSNGQIRAWGYNFYRHVADSTSSVIDSPMPFSALKKVNWVGGGRYFTCAKTDAEGDFCWGRNYYGAFGQGKADGSSYSPTPVPVVVGAAKTPETVVGFWGGYGHNLALTAKGEVWCAGYNTSGQCGLGNKSNQSTFVKMPLTKTAVAVRGAYSASCVLDIDGDIWCTGDGAYQQHGNGSTSTIDLDAFVKVLDPYAVK